MSTAVEWKPSPKVVGGGVAGAVTTIVLWLVDELTPLQPPTAVAAAVSLLVTIGAAYLVPAGVKAPQEDQAVDERPLTDDERRQVAQAYDWFSSKNKQQNGG
jgi:hypothetical protein